MICLVGYISLRGVNKAMEEKTGLRIASFNIQKFSSISVRTKSDGGSKKDLDTIGRIIRENHFDIIAIQEIYHKEALKELLEKVAMQYAEEERLYRGSKSAVNPYSSGKTTESFGYRTKHWEGRWASPKSYYGDSEGYAFIWNRDRIKLVTNRKGEVFEPRIEEYIAERGENNLVRPPFLGRFMPISGRYEIRLINTHIAFNVPAKKKKEDDESYEPDLTDIEFRKREFTTLIRTVYRRFSKEQYDVNRKDLDARCLVPYTFLLGDYNLNLMTSPTSTTKLPADLEIFETCGMRVITVNDKLTTLKKRPTNDQKKEQMWTTNPDVTCHMANNYDHFSYDDARLEKRGKGQGIARPRIDVVYPFGYYEGVAENGDTVFDLYRSKISDHVPIYIDFDVRKRR